MAQPIDWKLFGTAAENVEKQAAGLPSLPNLSKPRVAGVGVSPPGSQSGGGTWWGAKQGPPGGAPGAQAGSMGPSRGAAGDADLQAAMQFTAQNQPNYMHDTFIPSIRNIPLAGGALAHLAGQLAGPDPRGRANQGQAGQAQAGSSGQAAGGTSGGQFSIPSQRLPQPGFGGRPAQPAQPVAPNPYDTTPAHPNVNYSIPPGSRGGYIPSDAGAAIKKVHDAVNRPLTHSQHDSPPPPAPGSPGAAPVNPGVSAPSPAMSPPAATPPSIPPKKVETGPDGQAGTSDDDFYKKQLAWWNDRPQAPKAPQAQQGGGFGPQVMQFIRSMFGPGGGMQFPGAYPGMMSMMMPRMMMPRWPGGGGGGMMFPQQQQQQQAPWQVSRPGLEAWLKRMPTRDDGASATPAAPSNEPGATQAAPSNEPGATQAAPGGGMVNPVPTGDEPSQYDQEMYALNRPDNQDPFSGPGGTSGLKPDVQEGFPAEWFESESAEQPAAPELPEAELPEPESPATATNWPSMEAPPDNYFPDDPGFTPPSAGRPDIDPGMTPPSSRRPDIDPGMTSDKPKKSPASPPAPSMPRDLPKDPVDRGWGWGETGGPFGSETMDFRPDEDMGGFQHYNRSPQSPTEWNDKEWMDNLREQGERGNLA